nr:hypothetical protein [uncultured Psychroserpens sp.]
MIKSILKKFQVKDIDVFVFVLNKSLYTELPLPEYVIKSKQITPNKNQFKLLNANQIIHRSTLFKKVFLLKLIHKKGPVIGDCYTHADYRGLSLYPKMIHYIAKTCLFEENIKELFIIVDTINIASIRGIEKTGFIKYTQITTKRWLWIYFNRSITYYN